MAEDFFALPPAPAPPATKKASAEDQKKLLRKQELRLAERQREEYAKMVEKLKDVPGGAATLKTAASKVAELDVELARLRALAGPQAARPPTSSKTWRRNASRALNGVEAESVKKAASEGTAVLKKYQVTAVPVARVPPPADSGDGDYLAAPPASAVGDAPPPKAQPKLASAKDILKKYSSTASAHLPRATPGAAVPPRKPNFTLAQHKRPPDDTPSTTADMLAFSSDTPDGPHSAKRPKR